MAAVILSPVKIARLILDIIYPPFCVGCGVSGRLLCANCFNSIDFYTLPVFQAHREELLTQPLNSVFSLAQYEGIIKKMILSLKYQHVKEVGKILARISYYGVSLPPVDLITAVPLHPARQRERGYNQAEVIAKELSLLTGLPYQPLMKRVKNTRKLASLAHEAERKQQLKAAFTCLLPEISQRVLVIDDVFTSGSTLKACAAVLKQAGCPEIHGLTIAHGN